MNSTGADAALITAIAGLIGVVVYVVNYYIKRPEDIRVASIQKDLDKSRGEVDYLSKRNKELESNLADATQVLLDFPKLKEQVSQLQKEVEDLRPRVMEYEKLTKQYVDLKKDYETLQYRCKELEIQVKSYKDILVEAVAKSKDLIEDGTSKHENTNTTGQSSTSS
jgi:predicted  nucleic acid-binding Zn-ribbon protein